MATNPVNRAFAASRQSHKKLAGVSAVILRGETVSSVITVTLGFARDFADDAIDLGQIYSRGLDILVDVADYDLGSGPVEPQRYDRIRLTIGGVQTTFEVLDGGSDSEAVYQGPDRTFWRLHTKEYV